MSEVLEKLEQARQLSEQMLKAANEGRWSVIAVLQIKRTALLEQIFPLKTTEHAAQVRPLLESIISTNQQLEDVCKDKRQSLQTELTGLNKNKKAVNAYRSA